MTVSKYCCQPAAGLSCQQCLGSLLHYHNETGLLHTWSRLVMHVSCLYVSMFANAACCSEREILSSSTLQHTHGCVQPCLPWCHSPYLNTVVCLPLHRDTISSLTTSDPIICLLWISLLWRQRFFLMSNISSTVTQATSGCICRCSWYLLL